MEQVMILEDGETFSGLDGCTIANVLKTGLEWAPESALMGVQYWIDKYQAKGVVVDALSDGDGSYTLIEPVQRFGPNPQHSGGAA